MGYPETRIAVRASVDSGIVDADPWSRIGSYGLASITFSFSRLGTISTPFELVGDVTQSTLHLYPSEAGGPGEVRLFGHFDQSVLMPNGIAPVEFDLRVYFASLGADSLASLEAPLMHTYSSLYVSDQLGARSSNLLSSTFGTSAAEISEPRSFELVFAAIAGLAFALRRARRSAA